MPRVLVIDDDDTLLFLIQKALENRVSEVTTATTAQAGIKAAREGRYDVVLLDLKLPDIFGLEVLEQIRGVDARLPVIVMTADADASTAIEAVQSGAYDYIAKPIAFDSLNELVDRAINFYRIMNRPVALGLGDTDEIRSDTFVGTSSAMLDVFKTIGRAAVQNIPVLIRGESGAGKELVARALYQHSKRAEAPYMAINCAALPETLLESELFGHEKGSFTGADRRRIGKFEQCSGGTIFLDEIGDMPLDVQAKVLRLLQEQTFERVGGNETITTDVRIVAATNRPLERFVEEGKFRADLLYRLNGVTIQIPPLRNRLSDLESLIQYFLRRTIHEMNRQDIQGLGPEALERLKTYDWPGNVRELQSSIRHAVLSANGPVIAAEHLPDEILDRQTRANGSDAPPIEGPVAFSEGAAQDEVGETADAASGDEAAEDVTPGVSEAGAVFDVAQFVQDRLASESTDVYAEAIEQVERIIFQTVLDFTGGNQSQASQRLGITRAKVRDRIATYGISVERRLYE